MAKNSRRIGHDWEREVADMLRDVYPPEQVRRGRQGEGAVEPDVVVPDALWPECKKGNTTWAANPYRALLQAERDIASAPPVHVPGGSPPVPRRVPVAFCKLSRGAGREPELLVAMRPADWLEQLKLLVGRQRQNNDLRRLLARALGAGERLAKLLWRRPDLRPLVSPEMPREVDAAADRARRPLPRGVRRRPSS